MSNVKLAYTAPTVIDWDADTGETELSKKIREVLRDSQVSGSWTLHSYGVDDFCLQCDCVTITVCRTASLNNVSVVRCEINNNGDKVIIERQGYWANILNSALQAW